MKELREFRARRSRSYRDSRKSGTGYKFQESKMILFSAPNEYNPNLKPILVGGAFGLFFYYEFITQWLSKNN